MSNRAIFHTIISHPPKKLKVSRTLSITAPSKLCINRFESLSQLMINKDHAYGWLKIDDDVDWHIDDGGRCFVYVRSGFGILWTENKAVHLSEGFYTIFNDKDRHSFELISRTSVLFIANIKGRMSDMIRYDNCYVK